VTELDGAVLVVMQVLLEVSVHVHGVGLVAEARILVQTAESSFQRYVHAHVLHDDPLDGHGALGEHRQLVRTVVPAQSQHKCVP